MSLGAEQPVSHAFVASAVRNVQSCFITINRHTSWITHILSISCFSWFVVLESLLQSVSTAAFLCPYSEPSTVMLQGVLVVCFSVCVGALMEGYRLGARRGELK